jgi:hypothetical protein
MYFLFLLYAERRIMQFYVCFMLNWVNNEKHSGMICPLRQQDIRDEGMTEGAMRTDDMAKFEKWGGANL